MGSRTPARPPPTPPRTPLYRLSTVVLVPLSLCFPRFAPELSSTTVTATAIAAAAVAAAATPSLPAHTLPCCVHSPFVRRERAERPPACYSRLSFFLRPHVSLCAYALACPPSPSGLSTVRALVPHSHFFFLFVPFLSSGLSIFRAYPSSPPPPPPPPHRASAHPRRSCWLSTLVYAGSDGERRREGPTRGCESQAWVGDRGLPE